MDGTVAGAPFADPIGFAGGTALLVLNAGFRGQAGIPPGDEAAVVLTPRADA